MRSIQEYFFIILSQHQACAERCREETAGKNRSDNKITALEASVHPFRNLPNERRLFTNSFMKTNVA